MANNTLFDGGAYWNDAWVQELDGDEERLYHFYITSPNLDKSGVYKQTERTVEFYVRGLGLERIREITEKFAKAKKVIRCGDWIIVPTTLKHQKYGDNKNVLISITEYLKKIPDEVFEALRECDYPLDLDAIRPPKKAKPDSPAPAAVPFQAPEEPHPSPSDTPSDETGSPSQAPEEPHPSPSQTPGENLIKLNLSELNSIESELNINTIGGGGNLSVPEPESKNTGNSEKPVNNTPKPPPNLFKIVKDRIKAQGFYLDDIPVLRIMKFIPDPAWFTDTHSVIDFVAQKIREDYKGKQQGELKRLFLSALTSWKNIKDEYPGWREKQTRADESRKVERLRKTPPGKCLGCGTDLNGGQICGKCGGRHAFSGETLSWELDMPDPDFSIRKSFSQILQENRGGNGPPK